MSKMTGNKQTDFIVLMNLNDQELGKVCTVNKYVNSLCNDPQFWLNRIITFFPLNPEEVRRLQNYLDIKNNRNFYIYLRSLESVSIEVQGIRFEKRDVRKYLPTLLRYLLEQTVPEEIIANYLKEDLPKWFNRQEIIYEMRRNFPRVVAREHFSKKEIKEYGGWMSPNLYFGGGMSKDSKHRKNFKDLLKD